MLKAIRLALKYKDLLEPAIELITTVQNSVSDGQLTKKEKSAIMSQMWVIIKKVQALKQKESV
jgi:hypothetical protein|tara:strand:- start:517 stop:705 length:189 start_codon:yes stop_codon:yes gene_type:complete